jgi:hypothetical protein
MAVAARGWRGVELQARRSGASAATLSYMDEWGSGDRDGGTPVMVMANFGSLVTYYVKSNAF